MAEPPVASRPQEDRRAEPVVVDGAVARLARIPTLDALRGLAVLAVVGFHLDLGAARGGWVGVDVFFVLSGFLITTLLLEERAGSGRVALGAFWARRARRLLPAVLAVLAATAVAGRLLGGPERYPTLRGDGLAALAYVANWRFIASEQSYFSSFSLSPLRHMWSLAIEEQFYLVWPLVFVALVRVTQDRRVQLAVLVAVAGLATWWTAHLVGDGVDASRAYYGSDTRLPTILAGCVAAIAVRGRPMRSVRARTVLTAGAGAGAALLLVVAVSVPESSRWLYTGGGFTVIAAAAAVVVVAGARLRRGPAASLGRNRFLVRAGLLSYSLYLWHWPVIVFLDEDRLSWPPLALGLVQAGLSWALAELSYRYVEDPVRSRRFRPTRPVPVALASVALVGLVLVVALPTEAGLTPPSSGGGERSAGPVAATGAPQVLVLGDSLAWVVSGNVPDDYPYGIRAVFQAQCDIIGDRIFLATGVDEVEPDCGRWPARWSAAVTAERPDAVLVTVGLRQLFDLEVDGVRVEVGSTVWERTYRRSVRRALAAIRDRTSAPIFWLDVPCYRWEAAGDGGEERDAGRLRAVNRVLREELAEDGAVTVVDYAERVCGGADGTETDADIRPDGTHLSRDAARELWRWLRPQIAAQLGRDGG